VSNFDFLKDYDKKLYKSAIKIEESVKNSPGAVQKYATPFLQRVLELLMAEIGQKFNSRKDFYYQLDAVYREGKIKYGFKDKIYEAYQLRNRLHDDIEEMERSELMIVKQLHKKLFYIAKKLYVDFNPDFEKSEGVPDFKPIEIDTSERELDLIEIPDFSEVIDIDYDYCIVCGEPNHSSYSLCCEKCNRIMDNANNFISIRNHFGKNSQFKKQDLIDYGIPEGYVNQLVSSMVREKMLEVKGINIGFNNMHLDEYLTKIDNYISVCELITKFRENKLTPSEIKQTREYKLGSRREKAFYQFYKIVNREIKYIFENYLLTNRDIWKSIDYSTITQEQLKRWYEINLGYYQRGQYNESFKVFNNLLIEEYLNLARQGILEDEIRNNLNVSDEVYDFWIRYDGNFERKLKEIKIDLLSQAIKDGKTKPEVIEYAGVTPTEYENLIKFSDFKDNDFSKLRNQEINSRKKEFIKYLFNFDLKIACSKAKLTVEDFYDFYENADINSQFYIKSTRILMDKYLTQRRLGKTNDEAIKRVGIKDIYLQRWLSRSAYSYFKDENMKVTVDLIIKGFKQNKPLDEIAKTVGIKVEAITGYIDLGERGSGMYGPLFEYYESKIIPKKLSKFLKVVESKPIRKALESSDLNNNELNKYYELGKSGDERFTDFYNEFLEIKKRTYVYLKDKGKNHKIAMKESQLSEEEYVECKDDLERLLRLIKFNIVLDTVKNKKTSNVAASKARCSVEEIYEWYFKGRDGDEEYKEFYEVFHKAYVKPSAIPMQEKLDNDNASIESLIRSNKELYTRKDVDIWLKNGIITLGVFNLDNKEDDEEDDEDDSKNNKNEVKEVNLRQFHRMTTNRSSLGKINKKDYDVEELKKQILKK